MEKLIKGFIICALIGVVGSCEKDNENSFGEQKIYFEHYEANFAWGSYYIHWVIDDKGNVRFYNNVDSTISINPDNLNDYLELFDSVIYTVDKTELDYYVSLISDAADGEIVKTEQSRADFGGTVFNCFNPSGNSFEKVTLSAMSNDLDEINANADAAKIDKWLKELNGNLFGSN